MSLYYSNGGPGPASKLLRVDAPPNATIREWQFAPAFVWTPEGDWKPWRNAQNEILNLGEYGMIDSSYVAQVQAEMRDRHAKR
jgi:hypothetical protein